MLVWEPSWISDIIHWMKAHTYSSRDDGLTSGIFDINLKDTVLEGFFSNEKEFLQSPISDKFLLFHFIRFLTSPILIGCMYIVFSQVIDYLGLIKISPKNINNIRSFCRTFFYYLPLLFLSFAFIATFFWGVMEFSTIRVINLHYWNTWAGAFMFIDLAMVVFLKFTSGWLIFIKKICK